MNEPVDLASEPFASLIRTSEAIPAGQIWVGPAGSDPAAAFRPGTTKGGRAEAGWFEVGTVSEDRLIVTLNRAEELW